MKALTTFLVFLISFPAFSQVTIWPKAGVNMAWTSYPAQPPQQNFTFDLSSPARIGFYGGVAVDIMISTRFSIRPEIAYNELNSVFNSNYDYDDSKLLSHTTYYHEESRRYLSMPVSFVLHNKIGKGDLQISLGGYISKGLNGGQVREHSETTSNTYSYQVFELHSTLTADKVPADIAWNPTYYNPLDIGLTGGLGFQINRFLINTQFAFGLTNTQPHYQNNSEDTRPDRATSNRSISLGVAYRVF